MNLLVKFHPAASEELEEASIWYESKRSGLALDFISEIDHCVTLASENPFQ